MNRRTLIAAALFGLASAWSMTPGHAADATKAQPDLPKERLTVTTRDGTAHVFSVEMATTLDQQEVGLMWRTNVPPDGGMLFDWGRPQDSRMWMKNTVSSLDMLFMDAHGVVRRIAERTTPRSLAVIDGGPDIRATLELAAGVAERLDIRVGDQVRQRIFGNAS